MSTPSGSPFKSSGLHGSGGEAGFSWTGDLAQVTVAALYAACHSLRFTGRVELKDDHHQAQITFLGGDPVEIEGGDTHVISLWNRGQFRAEQSLPNLTGELTGQIEQTGSLAITKAPRLLAWVLEYRLTSDLTIERPGENAHLVFRNGQLESAEVNGRPELAALGRVQGWTDGFYRISLRPLFTQGDVIALQAPPHDNAAPAGREFDLSRSIPLDLKERARMVTPSPTISVGEHAPTEGERAPARPAPMARLSSTGPAHEAAQPALERFRALPPPERREPTARWPWVVVILIVVLGGGTGLAYWLRVPPFASRAPKIEAKVEPKIEAKVEPKVEAKVEPKIEPKIEAKVEPKVEAKVEPNTPPAKIDPAALEPKTTEKTGELPTVAPLDARLIDKGRLLLIEGHPHSAGSLFRKAEQANPKSTLAKTLEQQALGKLGRAELMIEGHGGVTIDGKRFEAPKKLKIFAGPHAVDVGQGPEELVLKKGERHRLHARP